MIAILATAIGFIATGGDDPTPPVGEADLRCDEVTGPGEDLARFFGRLDRGETGCLREGTHTTSGTVAITSPGVTLTSYPGESATLAGRLWVQAGADGAVVEDLSLDGRNEDRLPSPTVNADEVVFRGNDVTNDHTAICFVIGDDRYGTADGTVIEDNRIHDCGRLPATNKEHGIYVAHADGTVIEDNAIYANADRGVQLYPDADRSLVTGNVIDGNGTGVIFGGDEESTSDDNIVESNLITNSIVRYNVESSWPGRNGSGNVVRGNCVWTASEDYDGEPPGSGIEPSMGGVRVLDEFIAEPEYDDPGSGDYGTDGDAPCPVPAAAIP